MSRPFPQLGGNRETLEVLNPFLQVIRSDAQIAIPVETLKGALGHFVATLEGDQLDSFINDILASKSLWKALGPSGMEEAVRPAPTVKVRNLKPDLKDGWFSRDKLGKACRAWLEQVFIASKKPKSDHVVYFYIGLLKGVDDASDIKWGQPREDIEEEVVVALSDRLQPKSVKAKEREMELDELEPGLESYCKAANHIDAARLRVLDLRVGANASCITSDFRPSSPSSTTPSSSPSATRHKRSTGRGWISSARSSCPRGYPRRSWLCRREGIRARRSHGRQQRCT